MEKTSRQLNGISKCKWTFQTISERFKLGTSYDTDLPGSIERLIFFWGELVKLLFILIFFICTVF